METSKLFSAAKMNYNHGILHVEFNTNTVIDKKTILEEIAYRKTLTGDDNFSMMVDLRHNITVTDEAVALVAQNPSPEHVKAIALITNRGLDHNRAKLYTLFDKPNILTKVFLNATDALDWLTAYKSIAA
jgi:hypothetical protein